MWQSDVAAVAIVVGFLAGAIPFSNMFAYRTRRVDLRDVGTGTVSGTSLYRVAGFGALAFAGVLDVAKGAVGPVAAGNHTLVSALAAGAAVAGHNWSPFLDGAGGRGLSTAIGALAVRNWPGSVVIVLGLVSGRFVRQTGAGSFLGIVALAPVLWLVQGSDGWWVGVAVAVPMLAKRVVGNAPPPRPGVRASLHRLVFDNDRVDVP